MMSPQETVKGERLSLPSVPKASIFIKIRSAGPPRNERGFMMNHTGGWMGGGMWIWMVIGVLVVVLLVVVINKLSKK